MKKIFIPFLLFYISAFADFTFSTLPKLPKTSKFEGLNIRCPPLLSHLDQTNIIYGTKGLDVEDVRNPVFNGTSYLSIRERKLTIAFHTHDDKGNRATFSTTLYLKKMLKEFEGRYDTVEWLMQKNTAIDAQGGTLLQDPDLDKFNAAYTRGKAAFHRQNIEQVKRGLKKPLSEEELHQKALQRATAATNPGFYIAGGFGFGKITVVNSLGEPGNYQMLKLKFEKNNSQPLIKR